MRLTDTTRTNPVVFPRTTRRDPLRLLTSLTPGKIWPVAMFPVLREDSGSGKLKFDVAMSETAETLLNGINVTCEAWYVSPNALDRFTDLSHVNRSYMGQQEADGNVTPYIQENSYGQNGDLFETMGYHVRPGEKINSFFQEAYAAVVNFQREQRSPKLPKILADTWVPADAFWKDPLLSRYVPDFDAAMIDGEVDLDISGLLPVRGIGIDGTVGTPQTDLDVRESDGSTVTYASARGFESGNLNALVSGTGASMVPQIFAELEQNGVKLSLNNIEMAKKTVAFAELRREMQGIDEDHLMDLLMQGIRVPDAEMNRPIKIGTGASMIGYMRRPATDYANLDKGMTTGETEINMNIRIPQMNAGGVIIVTMQIVPERLFERQQDPFLSAKTVDDFPSALRDYLDTEKVSVVQNRAIDVEHTDPDGTFGYAALNDEWNRDVVRIGGKFHRKTGDPFDEDRQRLWAVETDDPQIAEDWYLVNELPVGVFSDGTSDQFEVVGSGAMVFSGVTQFGKRLYEDNGHYDAVAEEAPTDKIVQA